MNHDSWLIVSSVLGVFLVMALGAFCRHRRWLSREADRSLASLTANLLLPAFFLDRILSGGSAEAITGAWEPPLFGFGITALAFGLAWAVSRWLGPKIGLATDRQQRSFALCVGICNYGYIPLPLAEVFYPAAEVKLILHNVGVDLALWSIGIAVITGGQQTSGRPFRRWARALFSAPLIAVLIAFGIRGLGGIEVLPASLARSIGLLSGCAIPMGLLLSGAIIIDYLRDAQWRNSWRTAVAAIAFRQAFMPLLMLALASQLASSVEMKQVLMLEAAMPAAVFPIVLVRLFDGDTAIALRVVLATSLSAILLIPLWLAIGGWLLGV